MQIAFTKMQGAGNDFVVIDATTQPFQPDAAQCRRIADRRFGIGCDQLLLVEPPRDPATQFHYRIFNADGSEVEQCGNGARCFARFVRDHGLSDRDIIDVGTRAGPIQLLLQPDGNVRVDMGQPRLEPAEIPFIADQQAACYPVEVDGEPLTLSAVSMGNPHAVLRVAAVDEAPVERIGAALQHHPRFPERVNAGFMQLLDRRQIRLRVYERGVGETLACGTGACAAVVAGRLQGLLDARVEVRLPGGRLVVEWPGEGQPVTLAGPAVEVFSGTIELADTVVEP